MRRVLWLVLALGSTAALAQNNSWSVDLASGDPAMEEIAPLVFRVTNASTSRESIPAFTLGIPPGPYDIDGATAPSGWRATTVDRKNRQITFRVNDACTTTTAGLRPGQSALFEVRVIGLSNTPDQLNQDIQKAKTDVLDVCNRNVTFKTLGGTRNWTLHALGARAITNLRALDQGDQLTLSLTINNASTATQSGIAPVAPTITGTAAFALVSGPTPTSVNTLAIDAVQTFTWVYRATARGTARFSVSARNTTGVSSPAATTADVNVGLFPAAVVATPTSVVSGDQVTLQLLPTNNGLSPLTFVTQLTPTVTTTGTATATLGTGPTPSQVDALGVRATTAFTTTWTVRGDPGDKVTFSARARATDANGAQVTSDPVSSGDVVVREFTITPSPTAVISGAGATTISYRVANGSKQAITGVVLLTPDANLFRTPTAGAAPAGWTSSVSTTPRGLRFTASPSAALQPGQSVTFTVNYASIGPVLTVTPTSHKAQLVLADTTTARAEGTVTVAINRVIPDVAMPVAVATPGRVHFTWSNPTIHDGVLVVRAQGAAPNTAPLPGRRYPPGTGLGNATVVYEDAMSFNSSFADTGLTNGVSYYYRVFNRDEYGIYSAGSAPTSAPNNYLLVIPPGTGPTDAYWCSTTGLPSLQQPFTDLGKAVYQSTNGAYFTSNLITVGAPVNGNEKWRPSPLRGVVQARPTAQKLNGATEPSIFVGDQLGFAYRVDGRTGAITWIGNNGVALGEVIQAQSVVAPRSLAPAAAQPSYLSDLVIFATRNTTNRSSNSVWVLNATDGKKVSTYLPGNLDQVLGQPMIDHYRQELWIGSLRTGGPSLRVINFLNPALASPLTVTDLGDVSTGVTYQTVTNQALVGDRNGVIRGYSVPAKTLAWQINAGGAVNAPIVAYQTGFFVSTATGVQRYDINTTTNTVTPMWAAPTAMRLPSSARVDASQGKVYVGDGDGYLRKLDLATGALETSVRVSTIGGVSMPSFDATVGLRRLYVGTADGRLCSYPTF